MSHVIIRIATTATTTITSHYANSILVCLSRSPPLICPPVGLISEAGGLNAIEELQNHENQGIYQVPPSPLL